MDSDFLKQKFSADRPSMQKALFSMLMISANLLQTSFDHTVKDLSLKPFMLLTMIRQSKSPLHLSQAAKLLGCSRQNIKKLALVLEQKNLIKFLAAPGTSRAVYMILTEQGEAFFVQNQDLFAEKLDQLFSVFDDQQIRVFFDMMASLETSARELGKIQQEKPE